MINTLPGSIFYSSLAMFILFAIAHRFTKNKYTQHFVVITLAAVIAIGGFGLFKNNLNNKIEFLSSQENSPDDFVYMFRECGLLTFSEAVTKACVRYLGMQGKCAAWCLSSVDSLVDALMADVFCSGNMGKADLQGESELFVGRSMLNNENQNAIKSLILNLSRLAYRHFPITKRCKWLLPIFWFYLPMRYIVRSLFGLRQKKSVFRALMKSNKRFELHKRLHLYEVK